MAKTRSEFCGDNVGRVPAAKKSVIVGIWLFDIFNTLIIIANSLNILTQETSAGFLPYHLPY